MKILIMVGCPKISCGVRGISYCYDCNHFGGFNKTMDEVVCDLEDRANKKKK